MQFNLWSKQHSSCSPIAYLPYTDVRLAERVENTSRYEVVRSSLLLPEERAFQKCRLQRCFAFGMTTFNRIC